MEQESAALEFWIKKLYKAKSENSNNKIYCLDVGSNGGFYSLLSRSLGCSVMAIDAQPMCLARISSSAAVNGYFSDFAVRWTAVSDQKDLTIEVGSNKCSGLWAVRDSSWINKESVSTIHVQSTPLQEIVDEWIQGDDTITMFKIDVEGSEMNVLKSALPYFKKRRILYVLAEISPARLEQITSWEDTKIVIETIYDSGYAIRDSFVDNSPKSSYYTLDAALKKFGPVSKGMRVSGRNAPTLYLIEIKN